MDNLKIGDRVRLRSGGPLMTVCDIDHSRTRISCRWFNITGDLGSAVFDLATLTIIEGAAHEQN